MKVNCKQHGLIISENHLYLTVETYGRIGLLRSYGNLQSYWTTFSPMFSGALTARGINLKRYN
jgi:hypothetical protein